MELRGMFGHQPVRVVAVANEWLDIIEISSGNELASIPLRSGVHLDGDLLSIGETSIVVDRSYLSEAQSLLKLAAQSRAPLRSTSDLPPPHFCTQCGSRTEPHAKFCTICGDPLNRISDQPNFSRSLSQPLLDISTDTGTRYRNQGWEFEGGKSSGRTTSVSARRILFIGAAVVVVAVVAFVVVRGGGDTSTNSSVDIRTTSACEMLSQYAFVGIPATYIDDGAQLLYSLADEFKDLDRGDIASSIEGIVDLTYQGPSGQLSAKNLLVETAATHC